MFAKTVLGSFCISTSYCPAAPPTLDLGKQPEIIAGAIGDVNKKMSMRV